MNPSVQLIPSELTFDLRDRVLRGSRPPESSFYAEDNLPSTFHTGALAGGRVVSCGTYIRQEHPQLPGARCPYRLRGMATDPDFRGLGLGRRIVLTGLEELRLRGADLLWFNARVSAEGFYRKLGFGVSGGIFDIPQVGPHKLMFRRLLQPA